MSKEFKIFQVESTSGTYAEMLEAFGLAKLVDDILRNCGINNREVTITNKGYGYEISSKHAITEGVLEKLTYFSIFKFIKKEKDQVLPNEIGKYFNAPSQKESYDKLKDEKRKIYEDKSLSDKEKKEKREVIDKYFRSELGEALDKEYDVYQEIKSLPYSGFQSAFHNFHNFRNDNRQFCLIVKEIMSYYQNIPNIYKKTQLMQDKKSLIEESLTAQQLYNPSQGKGLNQKKANTASMGNEKRNWISETMKISGALEIMICKKVKVSSKTWDNKIFVPDFQKMNIFNSQRILLDFKKHIKNSSPIRLDILNLLKFSQIFIQNSENYKGSIKNSVGGFFSVYQKNLGKVPAIANIAYLEIPEFIKYQDTEGGQEWFEILEENQRIINGIEEGGNSIHGLLAYRNFLSGADLDSFFKFSYWYATYLMQELSKKSRKYKPRTFTTEILTKFYTNMDNQLSKIIKNRGFKAIAKAIRESTVRLQYPKEDKSDKRFKIRYGLAQELQNKSKSHEDLATFIGEFMATYSSETARYIEKHGKIKLANGKEVYPRANVSDAELDEFYQLLAEQESPRLVGAMLASYGFARSPSEHNGEDDDESDVIDLEDNSTE